MDEEEKVRLEKLRDLAVEKYRSGELSMAQAAEFANMTMWDFVELLKQYSPKASSEEPPQIPPAEITESKEEKKNDFGIDDI
ncbi:UPF0175 family protein [Candidatus Micrarchaeota archaeon]|nr:UPF0175 family protein [Candidatus Micrarchaeota archaeon]